MARPTSSPISGGSLPIAWLPFQTQEPGGACRLALYRNQKPLLADAEEEDPWPGPQALRSQEVLYRSLGYLSKLKSPEELAVWLYTVTRNRCWRMRRKSTHAPAHMLSDLRRFSTDRLVTFPNSRARRSLPSGSIP